MGATIFNQGRDYSIFIMLGDLQPYDGRIKQIVH